LRQQWLQQGPLGQQQQQQRRVQTHAVQADVLLDSLSSVSGWLLVGAALLVGMLLGLALAKLASNYLRREADPYNANFENAELRTKVSQQGS
jgi:hypothetical protein